MEIQGTTVLVTGANRGLGRSLVEALLERGAAKVYAASRTPTPSGDPRVIPVALDLTEPGTIAAAAGAATDATIVINNAGTAAFAGPLDASPDAVRGEMAVNYDGTFDVIRAFVPPLERNGGGAIVNVLSLLSLASTPPMAGYSASKAAAHSLTQALRPVLRAKAITVHGVYPAGIDTDMLAGIDAPKTPPRQVAEGLLDGLAAGQEDIFPDPNAQAMARTWWADPKAFERAFSGVTP
jgi:NAD(P)-dependent dehydrogenase (short-subunit alcohol dehydrogenase family)